MPQPKDIDWLNGQKIQPLNDWLSIKGRGGCCQSRGTVSIATGADCDKRGCLVSLSGTLLTGHVITDMLPHGCPAALGRSYHPEAFVSAGTGSAPEQNPDVPAPAFHDL